MTSLPFSARRRENIRRNVIFMKATGIVRRIDDLGRVVIPKEIRRTMRIREGDPLEIYTDNDGEVIFKKYSPLGELGNFSSQYAEVLFRTGSHPVVVCDRDHVIAVAGIPKKELLERRVSTALEDCMEQRKVFSYGHGETQRIQPVEGDDRYAIAGAPIIAAGDVCGSIMFLAASTNATAGDTEIKLIATAAAFLGKQMEE
jgi:AbrB family transcriptional regulator (stage V sporulation protein T)